MTEPEITAPALAGAGETIRLLRRLARKGAAGGVAFTINNGRVDMLSEPLMMIAETCWHNAIARGLIKIVTEATLATLTGKGRAHLRRAMTTSGQRAVRPDSIALPQSTANRPTFNPRECSVTWLSHRRNKDGQPLINTEQLAAAERLRTEFWFAGMVPRITTNWAEPASRPSFAAPDATREHVAAARDRVRRALAAVGPELSSLLIDVCCHQTGLEKYEQTSGWPQRSARVVLDLALTRLARHYGLLPGAGNAEPASRIKQWGTSGYRPAIDGMDSS
jgi:Domain of unknown function (DUF6456)